MEVLHGLARVDASDGRGLPRVRRTRFASRQTDAVCLASDARQTAKSAALLRPQQYYGGHFQAPKQATSFIDNFNRLA